MFENTGLDMRFLADVHNVATHLKEIKELLQVVLPVVVNNGLKVTLNEKESTLQVAEEPTQAEPLKGKWKCVYVENGHVIESDTVEKKNLAAWFRDSYKHHTGRKPSNVSVSGFVHGVEAVDSTGGLERVWHCFSLNERKGV